MKILIVGAGIGGLTLASFLKDSDIEFDIVDKSTDWHLKGFSLGLWNNGRNILSKLALAEKFDKAGTRIQYYRICDGKGRELKKFNLTEFYSQYGVAYTNISRALLHDWLVESVGKEKISLGISIRSIEQNAEGVKVEFLNGDIKEYDAVIGADGIHSQVRTLVFGDSYEQFDDWRVWYAWIDNKYKQRAVVTEYIEPKEFVAVFDSGEKTLAVLIAPAKHEVWDDVKGRIERLKHTFQSETALTDFLSDLKDEDIVPTNLSHIKLERLVKNRVVLMGDAAHGFEPHAGLGASMAMEDGYILAGELMKVSATYSLSQALHVYETKRKSRVALARQLTNRMRAWAFIKSKVLRKITNFMIPFVPERFFTKQYHKLLKENI